MVLLTVTLVSVVVLDSVVLVKVAVLVCVIVVKDTVLLKVVVATYRSCSGECSTLKLPNTSRSMGEVMSLCVFVSLRNDLSACEANGGCLRNTTPTRAIIWHVGLKPLRCRILPTSFDT